MKSRLPDYFLLLSTTVELELGQTRTCNFSQEKEDLNLIVHEKYEKELHYCPSKVRKTARNHGLLGRPLAYISRVHLKVDTFSRKC